MKIPFFPLLFLTAAISAYANPYAAEAAIYKVEVPHPNGKQMGFGSGVLVAQDKILTNCHVLNNNPGWPRVVHRQTGQRFTVTKHYNLGPHDACILVGGFSGTPVQLGTEIRPGESVWTFGYPAGLPVVIQGGIKGVVDTGAGKPLQFTASCAPGSSGGPVINIRGSGSG